MTVRDERRRQLLAVLADLLAYPRGELAGPARWAAALAGKDSAAAAALHRFAAAIEAFSPSAAEELYTATFDLEPACAPYLGVQLLGDDPVRGLFLARLHEVFAAGGFRPREELADHVAEVLGYLAVAEPGPERDDLVADALLPALDRMIGALAERPNPYRDLLAAARELVAPVGAPAGAAALEVLP